MRALSSPRCLVFIVVCVISSVATGVHAEIIYVDDDAPLGGQGASWSTAYIYLQDALFVAESGDDIRIAAGVYRPDRDEAGNMTPGDRRATFQLQSGVAIYGGYAGRGTPNPDRRDTLRYETILSGDQFGDDIPFACTGDDPDCDDHGGLCVDGFCILPDRMEENSQHVVNGSHVNESAILNGVTISGGNAQRPGFGSRGGGVLVDSGSPALTNCFFIGNAAMEGGGMYTAEGNPTLTHCTFDRNFARKGGGLANRQGNPILSNCTFSSNSANDGGGMFSSNGAPALTDCTFEGNRAESRGGALKSAGERLYHEFKVIDCIFRDNTASHGGAVENADDHVKFIGCIFEQNHATSSGGAVHAFSGNPILIRCTLRGNSAPEGGGVNNYKSSFSMFNCRIYGNNASVDGGGIYQVEHITQMYNCIISGNSAANNGGGVFSTGSTQLSYSEPQLVNCTVIGNSAGNEGGGIFNATINSVALLTNCILWANRDASGTGEASQISGTAPTINYSCVEGWTGQLAGKGNIGGDPLFVDSDGPDNTQGTPDDDVRLRQGSPCIDAADNSALTPDYYDLDGDGNEQERWSLDLGDRPRYVDNFEALDCPSGDCGSAPLIDMGAFESSEDGPGQIAPEPSAGLGGGAADCGAVGALSFMLMFCGLTCLQRPRCGLRQALIRLDGGSGVMNSLVLVAVTVIAGCSLDVPGDGGIASQPLTPDSPLDTLTLDTMTLDLGAGVTMELIRISAGTFMMGTANGVVDEQPVHRVTINRDFWIGRYEVTTAQYRAVLGGVPGAVCDSNDRATCPAVVEFEGASAFTSELANLTERAVRLPTEAEWEYACRAGTSTVYYFGDEGIELDEYAWYARNAGIPHPVGQLIPNNWGLYDTLGNVWEWCSDFYGSTYYAESPEVDPMGPEPDRWGHSIRGGAAFNDALSVRSGSRGTPFFDGSMIGFRVAIGI